MVDKSNIEISISSVIKIILLLLGVYLLFLLRSTLVLLFFSLILVAAFRPVVSSWGKKIGKPLAVATLSIIGLVIMVGFVYLIVPPFIREIRQLLINMPNYIQHYTVTQSNFPTLNKSIDSVVQNISGLTSGFISLTAGFFGGLVSFVTMIVLTIYLLLDEKIFSSAADRFLTNQHRDSIVALGQKLSLMVGSWLRGQLLLGVIMGVITFIGYTLIGLPYALALAVIAGLLEIVPIFGPLIAGFLAVIVALSVSPLAILLIVLLTALFHQLENNLIVPKVMQKAVGLPPAIIIIAIIIGGKLLGILGALMAVPIAAIIYVLFQEWETVRKIFAK